MENQKSKKEPNTTHVRVTLKTKERIKMCARAEGMSILDFMERLLKLCDDHLKEQLVNNGK